jgi:carboxypeptidase C (cathepsin A)
MSYQKHYFKKNKYNAKKKEYNGRYYDSIMEANYAIQLDWRKKAGEIKEIIPQYKIALRVNDKHICNYYIDFKIIMKDDSIEFHEVKGMETQLWRLKWKLTEALYPDYKLVLIK